MPTSEPDTAKKRLQEVREAAQQAGVKLTHQRLEIFRALAGMDDHPDADRVFRAVRRRMPTVSLDTVYRTLWLLHDLGLVRTLGPQRDGVRFDANLDQHHHFACVRCGLVRDFASVQLDRVRLPDRVTAMGTVLDAHVEVRGICAACRDRPPARTKGRPGRVAPDPRPRRGP